MDKELVISNIEKLINAESDTLEFCKDKTANAVEAYLENVVIRLVNVYEYYSSGKAGVSDYLCALREFMLAFRTELRIEDTSLFDNNHFSIYFNPETHKYYATYDVPQYIKNKAFIETAFINDKTEKKESASKYCLEMNSFLKRLTGFTKFKSLEQKLCVFGAINTPSSYTALISMPTGGGKSLVTQSLAYNSKGLTIVVVPTVSLAIDQERVAKENIKIAKDDEIFCYYSGANNIDRITSAIKSQKARLLFISPEALIKNDKFKELIGQANSIRYIKNIIVDEAHIVVAWGDFFRVDYQCLGPWRRELLKENPEIRTFLLSATFTDNTVNTLKKIFSEDKNWIEIRCDSLRKEPRYILIKSKTFREKRSRILELVNLLPKPMILYVNSPYDATYWKDYLYEHNYCNIRTFTGDTKQDERRRLINEWTENKYEIMIATSAFGVGVDKPDVRTVLHLYVPENPDAYYQELGRGGRDGLNCLSIMCIEDDDISKAFNHVSKVLTTEKLWGRWWSMYKNPDNIWSGGEIALFASTKPNYSRINYFEEGNETDEKWNINVLLLLNRQGLIKINSIELDGNNRYIFTVRIVNEQITVDSPETQALFESIRDKESNKSLSEFSLIRKSIEKCDDLCWSSMFYDTYPLVSEYCSGCMQHEEVVFDEPNRFPLLMDIKGPGKKISDEVNAIFSLTDEAIVFMKESGIEIVNKYRPDIVIISDPIENEEDENPQLMYMNFDEYAALQKRDNKFYISGLIMAFYSNDEVKAAKQYQLVKKYKRNGMKLIHVTTKDFVVAEISGKRMTEDVDGRVIE